MKLFLAVLATTLLFSHSTAYPSSTITFTCDYQLIASEDGLKKPSSEFMLRFVVDTNKNNAYMLGNLGSTEVTIISTGAEGVTFVEVTDTGNVMTTTITKSGDSVHSRNSVVLGDLVPSQYYGKCVIQ